MKQQMRLILALLVLLTALTFSCKPYNDNYRVLENGNQRMVVVTDNNGSQFLMDYLLFQSLMSSGGYGNVISHYHQSPTNYPRYNASSYSGWKSTTYTVPSTSTSSFRSTNYTPSGSSSSFRSTTPTKSTYSSGGSSFRSSGSSFKSNTYRPSNSSSSFRSSSSRSSFRSR